MTSQLYIAEQTCLKNAVLPDFSEHQQVDILIFKITIFLQNIFIKKQNRSIGLAVSFSECIAYTLSQTKLLPSSQPVGSGCVPKCACPPRSEALTERGAEGHRPQVPGNMQQATSVGDTMSPHSQSVAEAWTHCFIVSCEHSPSTQWGLPHSSHSPEPRSGDKKFQ